TDRVKTLARADHIDDGRSSALVARGRDDPARFVEQHVAMRRGRCDGVAIDLDARVGRDLAAHLSNDLAGDAHAALAPELLGRAARRDAAIGEHLLQSNQPGSLALAASAPSRTSAPSGPSA